MLLPVTVLFLNLRLGSFSLRHRRFRSDGSVEVAPKGWNEDDSLPLPQRYCGKGSAMQQESLGLCRRKFAFFPKLCEFDTEVTAAETQGVSCRGCQYLIFAQTGLHPCVFPSAQCPRSYCCNTLGDHREVFGNENWELPLSYGQGKQPSLGYPQRGVTYRWRRHPCGRLSPCPRTAAVLSPTNRYVVHYYGQATTHSPHIDNQVSRRSSSRHVSPRTLVQTFPSFWSCEHLFMQVKIGTSWNPRRMRF